MKKTASVTTLRKDSLLSLLNQFPSSSKFWIAYSGGMDSSVLLHLFHTNEIKINQEVEVLYVNHGLQQEADDWGKFSKKQCQQYDLPFTQLQINDNCPKGESIEAWARDKRYELIEEIMNENDVLFTGHHKDDQVETFFLQALRGAGPRGLASMPIIKEKNNTFHVRPLLSYSREDLTHYATEHNLKWQDDKSNVDNRYDRNYFRHNVAPIIEERWPAYRDTVSRLIEYQKEYKHLLNDVASDDIKSTLQVNKSLNLEMIKTLSVARQKNLVFVWLRQLSLQSPGSKNIEKIITDVINSSTDKSPCVNWANVEVRRYKNSLYAMSAMQEYDVDIEFKWQPENILNLFEETLFAKPEQGIGISKEKVKEAEFIIRFRKGGEEIKPDNFSHNKTVKQLFQERSVLPWFRDKIPLVYIDNELAAIPGFCVDKNFLAEKGEPSWDIQWSGYKNVIQS
jgi:tRNA(Ile)-lysidine synthase